MEEYLKKHPGATLEEYVMYVKQKENEAKEEKRRALCEEALKDLRGKCIYIKQPISETYIVTRFTENANIDDDMENIYITLNIQGIEFLKVFGRVELVDLEDKYWNVIPEEQYNKIKEYCDISFEGRNYFNKVLRS